MKNKRRILVFQHIAIEHPGIFRDFLADDGIEWDAAELDEGEAIPNFANYDGLWVMGGPMDTWEEAEHPWLKAEKEAIREAVTERKLPYLGLCLGHQLLADALGGEVGPSATPEIGIMDVEQTEHGLRSPFLRDLPRITPCLQWHGAEVKQAPPDSKTLVSTPRCRIQALQVGATAFSVQYHVEITAETVPLWGDVPAYKRALEDNLGPGALAAFESDAQAQMAAFNRNARTLYDNWMAVAFAD